MPNNTQFASDAVCDLYSIWYSPSASGLVTSHRLAQIALGLGPLSGSLVGTEVKLDVRFLGIILYTQAGCYYSLVSIPGVLITTPDSIFEFTERHSLFSPDQVLHSFFLHSI